MSRIALGNKFWHDCKNMSPSPGFDFGCSGSPASLAVGANAAVSTMFVHLAKGYSLKAV